MATVMRNREDLYHAAPFAVDDDKWKRLQSNLADI
jgi:hypothetical protein